MGGQIGQMQSDSEKNVASHPRLRGGGVSVFSVICFRSFSTTKELPGGRRRQSEVSKVSGKDSPWDKINKRNGLIFVIVSLRDLLLLLMGLLLYLFHTSGTFGICIAG